MEALVNHVCKVPPLPLPRAPSERPCQEIHIVRVGYCDFTNWFVILRGSRCECYLVCVFSVPQS